MDGRSTRPYPAARPDKLITTMGAGSSTPRKPVGKSPSECDDEILEAATLSVPVLRVGTRVQLHGLVAKPELNGRVAIISASPIGEDPETARYPVRLADGTLVSVRCTNLRKVSSSEDMSAAVTVAAPMAAPARGLEHVLEQVSTAEDEEIERARARLMEAISAEEAAEAAEAERAAEATRLSFERQLLQSRATTERRLAEAAREQRRAEATADLEAAERRRCAADRAALEVELHVTRAAGEAAEAACRAHAAEVAVVEESLSQVRAVTEVLAAEVEQERQEREHEMAQRAAAAQAHAEEQRAKDAEREAREREAEAEYEARANALRRKGNATSDEWMQLLSMRPPSMLSSRPATAVETSDQAQRRPRAPSAALAPLTHPSPASACCNGPTVDGAANGLAAIGDTSIRGWSSRLGLTSSRPGTASGAARAARLVSLGERFSDLARVQGSASHHHGSDMRIDEL